MAAKGQAYVPSMRDEAVRAKTGKDWKGWFDLLDKVGVSTLGHRAIAELLWKKHGVSGWWSQMVTVEYERARGLRVRHETEQGFSVAVSKTLEANLSDLYAASASAKLRARWFPGSFEPTSKTRNKYVRGPWKKAARLAIGFFAKGNGKSQISLQVSGLANRAAVERERGSWKKALAKLEKFIET
jgi:hypothetical protein